ncbi:MAG: hypothetical protein QXT64_07930 [Desulfurococcaceae archaeon]
MSEVKGSLDYGLFKKALREELTSTLERFLDYLAQPIVPVFREASIAGGTWMDPFIEVDCHAFWGYFVTGDSTCFTRVDIDGVTKIGKRFKTTDAPEVPVFLPRKIICSKVRLSILNEGTTGWFRGMLYIEPKRG